MVIRKTGTERTSRNTIENKISNIRFNTALTLGNDSVIISVYINAAISSMAIATQFLGNSLVSESSLLMNVQPE